MFFIAVPFLSRKTPVSESGVLYTGFDTDLQFLFPASIRVNFQMADDAMTVKTELLVDHVFNVGSPLEIFSSLIAQG